ncbi:MAG: class I SAM-dependent methyltransferase [Planctomycetota bacterium]|nr:class I SAM-dependent methyltransferase [Planctomycetota bacterium]
MSVLPIWRADQKKIPASKVDAHVSDAALELASSIESIKLATDSYKNAPLAAALVQLAMDRCLQQLAATGLWGQENRMPSNTLYNIVGHQLERGWLQNRARKKPLGYAGDHQLLTRICNRTATEDRLGFCFDQYFLSQSAPEAVRQRTNLAARHIAHGAINRKDRFCVLGVGCGPALEIDQAVNLLGGHCKASIQVTLLDLCGDAVSGAEKRISELLPPQNITAIRENLPRLPQRVNVEQTLGTPHLILCPGLFDYLEDTVATGLLELFWRQLAPGGTLLIGNFAPNHATRAYMEWIGNWYLMYRSYDAMVNLADRAGLPLDCLEVGTESTGEDWFLVARKLS